MWNEPRRSLIVVLSGPSGSGKTSVARRLSKVDPSLHLSISATTRPPRNNEVDGRDYHFLSPEEFERRVAAGDFVEHAVYEGYRYGTLRSELEPALRHHQDVLLEIDVQGAEQVLRQYPQAVSIWILPPTWEDLERRLRGRRTESEDKIQARLQRAREECRAVELYRYWVCNEDGKLDKTVHEIHCILIAERCRANKRTLEAIQREFGGGM